MTQQDLELPGEPERRRKKGDRDPEIGLAASALQKSIRVGDEELAVGWALLLWKKAPWFCWKRVLVTASEDVGLAAPEVVAQVAALHWMYRAARSRRST
jgi:replication-associated recombination protein RarA